MAIETEGGLHPKHRLIGYHKFFIDNISINDRVLDIGCGNGSLDYDVAEKAKEVVGIDISERNIAKARRIHSKPNIKYIVGDAVKDLSGEKFDVIILSNVLEHIKDRVEFMKSIKGLASKYLIRVPMLDRDWIPLYKKELGVEWRLDLTHYTEFTRESFEKEITSAGYQIESLSVQFGEIWAVIKI
ncbi:MAG TPA: class I SAM-dependent methyltransferase [Candidatus Paceibacterota bacterium]|nr:class I SAM-dependent methyltransferase [Candidatus Paceibacterota bacterium]